MAAVCQLAIIIPAYNESRRLGPTLTRLGRYAAQRSGRCQVVVVDDGSSDDTAALAQRAGDNGLEVRVLVNSTNRGKGYSVRRGMLAVAAEQYLFTDADLSVPIEELDQRLLPWVGRGYDVVIGSRDLPQSRLDPPQPWPRRLMGLAFRALRRHLVLADLLDTQCGFKLFSARAAQDVFSRVTIPGFGFDCQALLLARQLGYRIREVGVTWRNSRDHRVRLLRDSWAMARDLWAVRRAAAGVRARPLTTGGGRS